MLVLVRNPQLERLRLQRHGFPGDDRKLDLLPALEPKALGARLTAAPPRSGLEEAFRLGSRRTRGKRGEEPVEPLAGCLGWNPGYDRGRASPSRIAAKKIPTPRTMNVSARLKAGQ